MSNELVKLIAQNKWLDAGFMDLSICSFKKDNLDIFKFSSKMFPSLFKNKLHINKQARVHNKLQLMNSSKGSLMEGNLDISKFSLLIFLLVWLKESSIV